MVLIKFAYLSPLNCMRGTEFCPLYPFREQTGDINAEN